MWGLREWRRRRRLRGALIEPALWQATLDGLPLLAAISDDELARLHDLTLLFLHEKSFEGVQGLALDESMRLTIAIQACLPILHLGLDWYDQWSSIVVYPDAFSPEWVWTDETGVEHRAYPELAGESWQRGPMILSWPDVAASAPLDGFNLVIHECAHKLDALNGETDGFPPLHRDMEVRQWNRAFSQAFEEHCAALDEGRETVLDPYAGEAPEEFFAVVTEAFFELPHLLLAHHPDLYQQLRLFFRQDPAARLSVA